MHDRNSSGRNQKVVEPVNQPGKDNVMKSPVRICPETHFLVTRKGDIKIASVQFTVHFPQDVMEHFSKLLL